MWSRVLRDAPIHEPTRVVMRRRGRFLHDIRKVLLEGLGPIGKRRWLVPAIHHATDFWTWRSLVHEGHLAPGDAVELVTAMVRRAREGRG